MKRFFIAKWFQLLRVKKNILAATGQGIINLVKTYKPDTVLMDVKMPVMGGIEATATIKLEYPLVRTIAISYSNKSSTVLDMIRAGADGYLLKDPGLNELTRAIRTVHTGIPYFTAAISVHLTTKIREKVKEGDAQKINLTKREAEILGRICEGETSKEIVASLYVSKRTGNTFRGKISKGHFQKLCFSEVIFCA